jgi:hypothetical protein
VELQTQKGLTEQKIKSNTLFLKFKPWPFRFRNSDPEGIQARKLDEIKEGFLPLSTQEHREFPGFKDYGWAVSGLKM